MTDFPKLTTEQTKRLFQAMINNWKMELDCMGFSPSEIFELEQYTTPHREALEECEWLNKEMEKLLRQ